MTKEIIIDGIDVNALYSDQIACMNRYEVARLFVKTVEQLNAKEQECEELKKQLIQKDEVNTFFNTLDWNSDPCEICPKKNCLDEIKGIVNFISNITNCDKAYYCKDKLDEILQKISECGVENEKN